MSYLFHLKSWLANRSLGEGLDAKLISNIVRRRSTELCRTGFAWFYQYQTSSLASWLARRSPLWAKPDVP